MKKLIFLRDGCDVKLSIAAQVSVLSLDIEIGALGYKKAVENAKKSNYDWYITTYPTILRSIDWWNEEEQKFEIYIPTKKGKLKNIQEFTDKEIRHAHNIENMFLGGVFDD